VSERETANDLKRILEKQTKLECRTFVIKIRALCVEEENSFPDELKAISRIPSFFFNEQNRL
jgi:hypothetical protein